MRRRCMKNKEGIRFGITYENPNNFASGQYVATRWVDVNGNITPLYKVVYPNTLSDIVTNLEVGEKYNLYSLEMSNHIEPISYPDSFTYTGGLMVLPIKIRSTLLCANVTFYSKLPYDIRLVHEHTTLHPSNTSNTINVTGVATLKAGKSVTLKFEGVYPGTTLYVYKDTIGGNRLYACDINDDIYDELTINYLPS